MPRQEKRYTYSVRMLSYASAEVKERIERGEEYLGDPAQLVTESFYSGPSEAKASAAFLRAVRKAMGNPLAIHVTVRRDNTIIAQVRAEEPLNS